MRIDEIKLLARAVKTIPSKYLNDDSDLVIVGNRTRPLIKVENKYLFPMVFDPIPPGRWLAIPMVACPNVYPASVIWGREDSCGE